MTKYRTFRQDLNEKLKDPKFSKGFHQELSRLKIGYQIAKLRQRLGWTQKELARRLGTSQGAITRLESGNYVGHSLKTLEKIAMVTGAELDLHFRLPKAA